jgi:hypothetical protein
LKSSPFRLEGKCPSAVSEFHDEDFAGFSEEDRGFGGDHLRVNKELL